MALIAVVTLAVASILEAVLFFHAQRAELLRTRLDERAFRNYMLASIAPAAVFALSVPIAILYDPGVALLSWLLIFPAEYFIAKYLRTD